MHIGRHERLTSPEFIVMPDTPFTITTAFKRWGIDKLRRLQRPAKFNLSAFVFIAELNEEPFSRGASVFDVDEENMWKAQPGD